MVKMVHEYRDRIYIRKDIILKLSDYGELNQSKLMSYCGLNRMKHKTILDEMTEKGLIMRFEEPWGNKKMIIKYKSSEKGRAIFQEILEPTNCYSQERAQKKYNEDRKQIYSITYELNHLSQKMK
jgi:predicted transcriptional regulator